jgi:hypothetical protein
MRYCFSSNGSLLVIEFDTVSGAQYAPRAAAETAVQVQPRACDRVGPVEFIRKVAVKGAPVAPFDAFPVDFKVPHELAHDRTPQTIIGTEL